MDIANQDLRSIYEYWRALTRLTGVAQWSDFDVLRLPLTAWPRIMLIDVIDEPCMFRVRLTGTYIVDAIGKDPTGTRFNEEEAPGISKTNHIKALLDVLKTRKCNRYYGISKYRMRHDYILAEMICLPFFNADNDISVILTAFDYPSFENKFLVRDTGDLAEDYPLGRSKSV